MNSVRDNGPASCLRSFYDKSVPGVSTLQDLSGVLGGRCYTPTRRGSGEERVLEDEEPTVRGSPARSEAVFVTMSTQVELQVPS